jgi:Xaa-Pro aminopeptidase
MDPSTYPRRLDAAADRLGELDLDALVVPASPDLAYLAGYAPMPLPRPTVLIVALGRTPTLIVPTLERPLAAACPAAPVLDIVDWRDGTDPYAVISEQLQASRRVAAGDRTWAVHLLALQALEPARRWTSSAPVLGPLRSRKDAHEIAALRRAAHGADAALASLLERGLTGRTERAVAADLAALLVANGHDTAEFTIVGSGPNSASPHHEPTGRTIEPGDAVVLDFGGAVDGYHSDITRTVSIGVPRPKITAVHAIVAAAQDAARRAIHPGVAIEEIDRAARAVVADAGYGERFVHRTGHGIGLELHEPPYAVAGDRTVLEAGMTFSVEPGIYLEGRFGVRIEDIVSVTDDGVDVLNEAPRALVAVP